MKIDLTLPTKREQLYSVKNVVMDDLYGICYYIRQKPDNKLKSFSFSSKQKDRKFYITNDGIDYVFNNKRDTYIFLVETYGSFE